MRFHKKKIGFKYIPLCLSHAVQDCDYEFKNENNVILQDTNMASTTMIETVTITRPLKVRFIIIFTITDGSLFKLKF